jgi:hypothetical protein
VRKSTPVWTFPATPEVTIGSVGGNGFEIAGFLVAEELLFLLQVLLEGMEMGLLLIIVLLLMVAGSTPRWDYSRSWGYGPSGGLSLILLIILILVLMGYIPHRF